MKFILFVYLLEPLLCLAATNDTLDDIVRLEERQACSLTPTNPSTFWYKSIAHNGMSPFIPDGASWVVHRNVKLQFGAKGNGVADDSDALQNAINAGNSFAGRTTNSLGTTGQPAVIYLPQGTYILSKPIQLYVGTVIVGDAIKPPTIKASANFNGRFMIYGKDPHQGSTTNFYIGIKNVVIDSTSVNKDTPLTLLDWSVSQGTQLTNVVFNMPLNSLGHVGVAMPEQGSGTEINDCSFRGGAVGLSLSNQQYHLKGLTFTGCAVGISVDYVWEAVAQGCRFERCGVGIDTTANANRTGFFALIDSSASSVGALVNTVASTDGRDSLVLENVQVDGSVTSTVTASGKVVLTGSVSPSTAWVWGNAYVPQGPASGTHKQGVKYATSRPSLLVDSEGSFYRFAPPTYREYDGSQFVNVKSVAGMPVAGDGKTDDTTNLQRVINTFAGCKVLFFPAGTYIVTDTLFFPTGSRVVGEVWSAISANGSRFYNPAAPVPMVKVGNRGDRGMAHFSDMLFTVADVLQGCTLLEVNMAGRSPGDVSFWNTHIRVGGAAGSLVQRNCGGGPAQCRAAYMLAHFTATSSAHVDNMWAWVADHDLDGGSRQVVAAGRGVLVEAGAGTWMSGLAVEHAALYQTNFHAARNVFVGFQQSEAPYWQGTGQGSLAPDPWGPGSGGVGLRFDESDPGFGWCGTGDAQCRMALYQRISGCENMSFYGGGFWTFFNNDKLCDDKTDCQKYAVLIEKTKKLFYFGINTHLVDTLVLSDGAPLGTHYFNPGGWGAGIAAWLTNSA